MSRTVLHRCGNRRERPLRCLQQPLSHSLSAWGLPEMSPETKACVECHKTENMPIYQQWGNSKHFRANVGCYECHAAKEGEVDAFKHEGQWIATIASHPRTAPAATRLRLRSSPTRTIPRTARILGSLDNVLAEVVEGNRGMITPAFQNGNSAAAVSGCWQCHGKRSQGPARRQAGPGHMAQHRDRAHQPPTARKVRAPPATAGIPFPSGRLGTRIIAASATWGRTIRKWRSTTNQNTASPFERSRTSSTWTRPNGSLVRIIIWPRLAPRAT